MSLIFNYTPLPLLSTRHHHYRLSRLGIKLKAYSLPNVSIYFKLIRSIVLKSDPHKISSVRYLNISFYLYFRTSLSLIIHCGSCDSIFITLTPSLCFIYFLWLSTLFCAWARFFYFQLFVGIFLMSPYRIHSICHLLAKINFWARKNILISSAYTVLYV